MPHFLLRVAEHALAAVAGLIIALVLLFMLFDTFGFLVDSSWMH